MGNGNGDNGIKENNECVKSSRTIVETTKLSIRFTSKNTECTKSPPHTHHLCNYAFLWEGEAHRRGRGGGVSQAVRGTQYNQIGPNQIINGKITNEEGKPETDPINVRGIRIQTEL